MTDFCSQKGAKMEPKSTQNATQKGTKKQHEKRTKKESEKKAKKTPRRIKPDSAVNGKRRIQSLKGTFNTYYTHRYLMYIDKYVL